MGLMKVALVDVVADPAHLHLQGMAQAQDQEQEQDPEQVPGQELGLPRCSPCLSG